MQRDIYSTAVGVERTSTGRALVVSRVVDAPPETVWDLLTDTRRWPDWGPSVDAVDAPTRYIETGTRGRVRLSLGGVWVPFEVSEFVDSGPNRRWGWTVAGLPATGHRVDALDGQSRVSFDLPLWAAGYVPVCRRALSRIASLATADDEPST